ncbi:hypothetical protein CEXT_397651 [Caerostris extrusa]|uniref:Uncharacterized protein n=1 Tax=Caerostris extrusa TaxID=172846 RepID=A0AAV4MZD4_CAEEX|nr:hypothetical protein CEXT_397651 [Caerostris extrusa]
MGYFLPLQGGCRTDQACVNDGPPVPLFPPQRPLQHRRLHLHRDAIRHPRRPPRRHHQGLRVRLPPLGSLLHPHREDTGGVPDPAQPLRGHQVLRRLHLHPPQPRALLQERGVPAEERLLQHRGVRAREQQVDAHDRTQVPQVHGRELEFLMELSLSNAMTVFEGLVKIPHVLHSSSGQKNRGQAGNLVLHIRELRVERVHPTERGRGRLEHSTQGLTESSDWI